MKGDVDWGINSNAPISHPTAEEGVRAFMGKGEEGDVSWIKEEFIGAW